MFLGTFLHSLDAKNRLMIPSKFRATIGTNIVLNKGFEGCLEMRSSADFITFSRSLMSFPQNKESTRIVTRQLLGNAADLEIDGAGRILVPPNLVTEANIKGEVVLLGLGDKIEIWDAAIYKNFKERTDETYTRLAENLNERGE